MAPLLLWARVWFGIAAVSLGLTGCAYLDRDGRRDALFATASERGWSRDAVAAGRFELLAVWRLMPPPSTLTVYLEGDGRAWRDRWTPSADPTPERPVGLRLALADPAPNILYLGRPCQYVGARGGSACDVSLWTSHRYSIEIVEALSMAIDRQKAATLASSVELIGYSGGGALAALIAARRTDVTRIVTIAANLDLTAWTRLLGVDPIPNSLDPAREAQRIGAIAQYHLVGGSDETVPPEVVRSYVSGAGPQSARRNIEEIRGYDHDCCWHENWGTRIVQIRTRLGAVGD